ncbi:DUF885 domain-containing protein [Sphingomonas sp. A2-49]|uniref:DUF885 domain-containing protein n=1 Tax=Sphingomonas sp. A2-49 TaxID=1391375 RepID=UPI0021D0686A|nr:DUF885 domain-containing protein [Sphingomonas sp. A2-49]MCU6454277.1 DUF885 domain-containing protein [Sphingomonas sp. A2-49]
MRPDRRALLGGLAATLAVPVRRSADDAVAALDAAAALPPAAGLARLAAVDAAALPPGRRLDLVTARAGLAIDARLALLPDTAGAAKGYRPAAGAGTIAPDHYALLLARSLGPVAPRAAQARLAQVLARLHARAAAAFAAIGDRDGSIGERYLRLWRDDRYRYADADAAVADMTRLLAAARGRVAGQVGRVPGWCTDVFVRSLSPAEVAAGRPGYRIVPAPDRQGGYIVDLKQLGRRPRWTMPGVVVHELLPGHMIQLGLEGIDPPHPLRIAYAASFVEGWGVHAETLAAADGAFADPRAMLGHLHWLIFRVARALVDIGIHLDRWSMDAAHARLIAWQGEPAYFAPFDTELARIVQEPASRVAEAMAWLAIDDAVGDRRGMARIVCHRRLLVHGRMRSDAVGNIS